MKKTVLSILAIGLVAHSVAFAQAELQTAEENPTEAVEEAAVAATPTTEEAISEIAEVEKTSGPVETFMKMFERKPLPEPDKKPVAEANVTTASVPPAEKVPSPEDTSAAEAPADTAEQTQPKATVVTQTPSSDEGVEELADSDTVSAGDEVQVTLGTIKPYVLTGIELETAIMDYQIHVAKRSCRDLGLPPESTSCEFFAAARDDATKIAKEAFFRYRAAQVAYMDGIEISSETAEEESRAKAAAQQALERLLMIETTFRPTVQEDSSEKTVSALDFTELPVQD